MRRRAVLFLAIASAACGAPPSRAPAVAAAPVAGARAATAGGVSTLPPASAYSVYDLGSSWRDQHGVPRTLTSLHGRPQVVAFVYTTCTAICPLTVTALHELERNAGDRAGYVLISIDPAHDSPVRLTQFAALHRLSSRWTLLSGSERNVRELAALLGVKYRRVAGGEIDHSATISVLDGDGRLVAQFDQFDAIDRAAATLTQFPLLPAPDR